MTSEQAQEIVNDIMARECESEQIRVLRFFKSPKAEILEPRAIVHRKFSSGPGYPPEQRAMTAAIGKS